MKRILLFVGIFIVGLAIGAGGIIKFEPSLLSHAPAPVIESAPFNPKTAVSVTESSVESNLAGGQHYINFNVTFEVTPAALTALGGSATAAASGSGGTGSPQLDAEVRNQLIALCRATPYSLFSSSGGLTVFKDEVTEILESIFGPGTVRNVYFSNLLTQ